jgi:hypothetical protein
MSMIYLAKIAPHWEIVYVHFEEVIVFNGVFQLFNLRKVRRNVKIMVEFGKYGG